MGTLIFPAQHKLINTTVNGDLVANKKASETFNLPVDDT